MNTPRHISLGSWPRAAAQRAPDHGHDTDPHLPLGASVGRVQQLCKAIQATHQPGVARGVEQHTRCAHLQCVALDLAEHRAAHGLREHSTNNTRSGSAGMQRGAAVTPSHITSSLGLESNGIPVSLDSADSVRAPVRAG
eukprot:TRINITY_DN16932_c0_g1_i1.p1 TRINITY_DN16932_c0_g1~~TRINITY_DN16932_c0_g1_i1.p1  ORF type:complete len:139 (+),score=14.69 TRINITY_DN16932_c0_g1_i1:299-715(+)